MKVNFKTFLMPLERNFKTNALIKTNGKKYLNIFPISVGFLDGNKNDFLRTLFGRVQGR